MASYASNLSPNAEELTEMARQAMRRGNKKQARQYLQEAIQIDPDNFMIWLWLASVAPTPKASDTYVQRAEQINPHDPRVKEARVWVNKQLQKAAPPTPEPLPAEDSLTAASNNPKKIPTAVVGGSLIGIFLLIVVLGGWLFWSNRPTAVASQSNPVTDNLQIIPVAQIEPHSPDHKVTAVEVEATDTPEPHVPAKALADSQNEPRATWTVTPTPTPTFTPTPTYVPTWVSNGGKAYSTRPYGVKADEKWIDVDLSTQTLTAYVGNDPVFSTYISSGTAEHPTVTGQFRIWLSYESQTMDGSLLGYDYYLENVPYVMYFYHDYAIHGTFWHNNFGTPMSHGCVNMETGDASWIYSWATIGTLVNVHN